MPDIHAIHNESFRRAMAEIIKPTMEAGGGDGAVMTVLESVVTGVLLALYSDPKKAAAMLEEGLVPGVIGRLTDAVPYRHT